MLLSTHQHIPRVGQTHISPPCMIVCIPVLELLCTHLKYVYVFDFGRPYVTTYACSDSVHGHMKACKA